MTRSTRRVARPIGMQQRRTLRIHEMLPYSWIDAKNYTVAAGGVDSLVDRVRPGTGIRAITADHTLVSGGADRCALPANSSIFKGQKCITTTGTSRYDSDSTGAAWSFLHDGSGYTIYAVASAAAVNDTTFLITNYHGVVSSACLILQKLNGTYQPYIQTAGGAAVTDVTTSNNIDADTAHLIKLSYKESESPEVSIRLNATASTQDSLTAPSPDTAGVLSIFCSKSYGTNYWVGSLAELIIFNRLTTTTENSTVLAYLNYLYGMVG